MPRLLACLSILLLASGLAFLVPVISLGEPVPAAAQDDACLSTGPESGAYSIRMCLTTPTVGADLTGNVTVSAEVAIEPEAAPAIDHVQFYLTRESDDSPSSVLRDYEAPYSFTLPTDRWSDGNYRLEMSVEMADDFESDTVGIPIRTVNGVTRMPHTTGRWNPIDIPGDGPVVVGLVGDGAGGLPSSYDVANLVTGWDPDMFFYLGDVYNGGSYTEFLNYYEPSFGPLKSVTNPVPGDHEGGRQFQGYLDYWDSTQQYYAVNAGGWRIFVLNTTERFDQIEPGMLQFDWLTKQLASTSDSDCTMVVSHFPRWGQSRHNDYSRVQDLWELAATKHVDILVGAHEHNYQRWVPMDYVGNPDSDGMTQFIVGTGGHYLTTYSSTDTRLASNHQGTFGALRMVLGDGRADYQYIDTGGNVLDAGDVNCGGEHVKAASPMTGVTGTIVNTNGLRAMCLAAPDYNAETITLLPEGTQVEMLGPPVGEWQPVRCEDQDGFVYLPLIQPDQ